MAIQYYDDEKFVAIARERLHKVETTMIVDRLFDVAHDREAARAQTRQAVGMQVASKALVVQKRVDADVHITASVVVVLR